jgi:xanthine dehydrogenase accessory factor
MDRMDGLLVVGDGEVSEALAQMAELLGWNVLITASLDGVRAGLADARAVVVTSHDDAVDAPAIREALDRPEPVAYIGAMGSRARQSRRREWMVANGVPAEELERVHGPAGLDIGADTPAEIALAILAELVAVVRGVTPAGSLRDRGGPIHPDLPPGEAFSPTG